MDSEEFQQNWSQISASDTLSHTVDTIHDSYRSSESIKTRLVHNNIFFVTKQTRSEGESLFFSAKTVKNSLFLVEMMMGGGNLKVEVTVKASDARISQHFIQAVSFLLSTSY